MKLKEKYEKLIDDYCKKKGIFASEYEKQMKKACKLGSIKFYDKQNYDSHMKLLFHNTDKPEVFDKDFITTLPDYRFLGIPIKRLIQNDCSNGYCYSIVLALSLCFDNFQIVTANLDNYAQYYRNHGHNTDYKHCFLLLPNDIVIDTTFGITCLLGTYRKIFSPSNLRYISSDELKDREIYQYIQSLKNTTYDEIFPQFSNKKLAEAMDTDEYWDFFLDWQNKNLEYKNPTNQHMEDYFTKHISRTSNPHCLWNWMTSIQYHPSLKTLNFESSNPEL